MNKFLVAAALLAASLAATPASAQATSANPKATAGARLLKPLALTALRNLNFGTVVMGNITANETVTINAAGTVTCGTSGNLACTGTPQSAGYRVTGTQGQTVVISSSAASFPLTGSNGGTLNFVPTFPATLVLGNSGSPGNDFSVGGSVTIGPSTADGVYTGQIDIQVAYQ